MTAAKTYSSYLNLDKILTAQKPKSSGPEHDEMLFIIIHQVYELWFKQILHEIDYLRNQLLPKSDIPRALHTFRRILTILKTVVTQIDVLETMTPLEFNSFRKFLDAASGFQSLQFRQLEFVLGYKRPVMLAHFPEDMPERKALEQRLDEASLWDKFLICLIDAGYQVPKSALDKKPDAELEENPELQAVLIKVYTENDQLSRLCERLVDVDEGIQEWRYRHVKMVQRTIGAKIGTGGSAGAEYLQATLKPLFPDLWAIRSQL